MRQPILGIAISGLRVFSLVTLIGWMIANESDKILNRIRVASMAKTDLMMMTFKSKGYRQDPS